MERDAWPAPGPRPASGSPLGPSGGFDDPLPLRARLRSEEPDQEEESDLELRGTKAGPDTSRLIDPLATPQHVREVLAATLAVPSSALRNFTKVDAATALRRIRQLADRVRRLEAAVAVDDLTGVLRRGAGLEALAVEIERARRSGGQPLTVAFVDVDGLKKVNDTLGHAAGDELLCRVAGAMRSRLRAYDLVLRFGGDEFVGVLIGADRAAAGAIMLDVATTVKATTGGHAITVGLAVVEPQDTADTVVARADAQLYEVRRSRRRPVS